MLIDITEGFKLASDIAQRPLMSLNTGDHLLGAQDPRSELTESGRITHGSIAQYEFLIANCFTVEEWDDHCAELWIP